MQTTNVSNLKAHLSEFLREVKGGESITVIERETPIARIIPIHANSLKEESIVMRRGTGAIPKMRFKGKLTIDPAELISQDRDER